MTDNPFKSTKQYNPFPNDVYIDACILSFQTAALNPGPMADTNDKVPSARFLFGGYIKNPDGTLQTDEVGNPIIARKWTRWVRTSNNKRAAIMSLFDTSPQGFQNLFDILQDFETTEGKLWQLPFKIILEQNGDYQNIIRIKPGTNTDLVANVFYDDAYIPYKVVKAYGSLTELQLAGCKFKGGVKIFSPEDMVEPTDNK